ncbi:MAG TPA: hypothetical protein VF636_07310 [Sphingomonas sp.]|jgi:hypothetical protein
MILAALLLAQAAAPDAEASRLGEELARSGTLSAILPGLVAKDTEELIAEDRTLSDADKTELRRMAQRIADTGSARLYAAMGEEYARRLSADDMRTLIAFNRSPAAARYRAAELPSVAAAMAKLGGMDFKEDVAAAFCRETGKLCARP